MSDTDDTDDLLLIPPDFFVIHSDIEDSTKPYGPYYKVVNCLITQVSELESRIVNIETAADSSLVSNSLDSFVCNHKHRTNLMSGVRKCNSLDNISPQQIDVYSTSTHSTPQKPRTKLKLNSLPSTPSTTERYIPVRPRVSTSQHGQNDKQHSPQFSHHVRCIPQKQNEMLSEIDNFISNVKTIQKFHAARNLNSEFDVNDTQEKRDKSELNHPGTSVKSGLNLSDVDQMLHNMESQQREIESRLKETRHELDLSRRTVEPKERFHKILWKHGENTKSILDNGGDMQDILYGDPPGNSQEAFGKEKLWQQGENKGSVPDRGMGMRDTMYNEPTKNINDGYRRERQWKQGDIKGSVPDRGMGMRDTLYNEPTKNIDDGYRREKQWKQGDNKGSVPDRGMGIRDILYDETSKTSKEMFHKEKAWQQSSAPDHKFGAADTFYNEQLRNTKESPHKRNQWKQDKNKHSIHTFDTDVKNVFYCEPPKHSNVYESVLNEALKRNGVTTLTATTGERSTTDSARNTDSMYTDNSQSSSSSDSTQMTSYQNRNMQDAAKVAENSDSDTEKIHSSAMQVLNKHKNLLLRNSMKSPSVDENNQTQKKLCNSPKGSTYSYGTKSPDYEPSRKNTLALLSLSELWNHSTGAGDIRSYHDHSKFLNKLQEEKLRRQHCEQLIQQLQTRTLELQERLAVAVQVDHAKDTAILRIHKSWEEAYTKIDGLNEKNSALELQITELRASISHELAEATKKVSHYESEASKALNLAHSSQEKVTALEKQNAQLRTELQGVENKLKTVQDNYNVELDKVQQLSKLSAQKELELNENKNTLTDARKEVAQSKRAVEICQTELTAMRTAQTQLELQLNQELNRAKEFEKEKKKLLADMERHKKIEKTLQEDLDKQRDLNEKNKLELRNFYQEQVEIVVREKLQEFQSQLEKAENSLQDEIHKRELSVAKAAAIHIQQLTEKHSLEIRLLEEKHKEEVKLYILQLSQAQQQIENLQIKFHQHQERRTSLAQQLHKVMEAQWLEVLKIINSSKSPVISQDKSTNTLDQLNFLKSKSYNNVEEILLKDEQGDKASADLKIRKSNMPFFQSVVSISPSIDDDAHRKTEHPTETPLTSRTHKNRQQIDNELQRYVQMLLNKAPGNPIDEQNSKNPDKSKNQSPDNHSSIPQWQQFSNTDKEDPDGTKLSRMGSRDRLGKPPWK